MLDSESDVRRYEVSSLSLAVDCISTLKCRSICRLADEAADEEEPEVEPNVGLPDGEVSADDEEFRYAVDSVPVLPYRPDNAEFDFEVGRKLEP